MKPNKNTSEDIYTPEIRRYVEGRMNAAEQHNFEKKMLDDPFLSDAVEGYQAFPDWNQKFNLSNKRGTYIKILAFVSGAVLLISVVYFLLNKKNTETITPIVETESTPSESFQMEEEKIIIEDVRTSDSSVSVLISRKESSTMANIEENFVQKLDPETLEPLPLMVARETEKIEIPESHKEEASTEKSSLRIYHIEDYKVFDYRGLRNPIEKLEPQLGGTPASGIVENNTDNHRKTQKVPYVKFLEKAITRFSEADFGLALADFNIILASYPDDVNALFYGGLCLYHKRAYDEAAVMFAKAESNAIAMFVDESQWYRAKAFYFSGKKGKAEELLELIVSKNGFYAKQAEEFLANSQW